MTEIDVTENEDEGKRLVVNGILPIIYVPRQISSSDRPHQWHNSNYKPEATGAHETPHTEFVSSKRLKSNFLSADIFVSTAIKTTTANQTRAREKMHSDSSKPIQSQIFDEHNFH